MRTPISTPMNTQQESPFARLPAEILARITRPLKTPEYSAVRQTCQIVERKTFSMWAHEFFRKKQFMISTFSLDALLDISSHPELRLVLGHLVICLDGIPKRFDRSRFTDQQLVARSKAVDDQQWLLRSGAWVSKLAAALASLPNLHTIDIRDFNSHTRFRDGPDAKWHSFGAATYHRESGHPTEFYSGTPPVDQVFPCTLLAIAQSQVTPRNFEVIARSHGLSDEALYIPPDLEISLQPFLSNLRKFHITVRDNGGPKLKRLLSLLPKITWLRINTSSSYSPQPEPFWEWFSLPHDPTSTPEPATIPPVTFPCLNSLDIGFTSIEVGHLTGIVNKYNLRSLTLWKSAFIDTSGAAQPPNLCADFLRSLSGTDLQRLTLGQLRQDIRVHTNALDYNIISFASAPGDKLTLKLPSRLYTGDDMFAEAARDTRMKFHRDEPSGPPYSDEEDVDDDDDDDDDGDDDDDDQDEDEDEDGDEDEG